MFKYSGRIERMKAETNYDALLLNTAMKAGQLFSDLCFCQRFIKSADDTGREAREYFIQSLRSVRIRIDQMIQSLE